MITKKKMIEEFKEDNSISRLTENSIYKVAEINGYRDLRGFDSNKYVFGKWLPSGDASTTAFSSNDKFEAIRFLSNLEDG